MTGSAVSLIGPGSPAESFIREAWPPANRAGDGLTWVRLAGDGSDRSFVRVRGDNESAVLVIGPDPNENRSYELIGRHLWQIGRFGPEFLASDPGSGLFLVEDLGDDLLQDLARGADGAARISLYGRAAVMLAEFHARALGGFDSDWCYQTRQYDRALILERETGYFMSAFVRGYLNLSGTSSSLAAEFEALAQEALNGTEVVLMHRDFQSRNILFKDDRPRIVDFQGARPGPPGYDLASLLYDPYVDLNEGLRDRILEAYIHHRSRLGPVDEDSFRRTYPLLAACRLLQALGAFGFLSRVKGKPEFERHIPAALRSLEGLLDRKELVFMTVLKTLVRKARSMEHSA